MSSTESPTSTDDPSLTSTTDSSLVSPLSTDELATDLRIKDESFQSYMFPILSIIIVIFVVIYIRRSLQRRRLGRMYVANLHGMDVHNDMPDEAMTAKLVRPRMFDVYLDGKELRAIGGEIGWKDIMPLSSHLLVHPGDIDLPSPTTHPAYQERSRHLEDSRQPSLSLVDNIRSAVLHGLKLLPVYSRRPGHEHQARHNEFTRAGLAASSIQEVVSDPNLPRKLVTEMVILMPSVPRALSKKQEHWEDKRFPDVAIGITY